MDPNFQTINTGAFGNLHILSPLGEGGMATVYLAELQGQGGFRSKVALKVIQPHLALLKPELRQWFADEARLGGLLRHDNIVQTQFFGEQEGMLYLAMEYVDGPSLHKVLNSLRRQQEYMPPAIAIQIMEGVCDGMIHAHEARDANGQPLRMVHRDLKPSNVMFTSGGLVKVCDFGVARAESNDNRTMFAGQAKGTARYMSPEQAYGDLDLDCRSDIFTLGAIFYELVTLMPLYEGDNPQRLLRMAQDANVGPRIDALPAHLPERPLFTAFFQRALARDVNQRFQTTREMLTSLENMLDRLPRGPVLKRWLNRFEEPQAQQSVPAAPSSTGASLPSDASLKSHSSQSVPAAHQSPAPLPVSQDATVAPSQEVLARMASRSFSRAQVVPQEPQPREEAPSIPSDATLPPPAQLQPSSGRTPLPQHSSSTGAVNLELPHHPAFSGPSGQRAMPSTPGIPAHPSSMGFKAHPSLPSVRAMPSTPGIPVQPSHGVMAAQPSQPGLPIPSAQPSLRSMPSTPGIQTMPKGEFADDVRATTVFPTQRPPAEALRVEPAPQSLMGESVEEVFQKVRTSGMSEPRSDLQGTFSPQALPTMRIQVPTDPNRGAEALHAPAQEPSKPPSQEHTVEFERGDRPPPRPVQPGRPPETRPPQPPLRPAEGPHTPGPAQPPESARPAWMLPALGVGGLALVAALGFLLSRGPKEVEVKPSATPVAMVATPAPPAATPVPATPRPVVEPPKQDPSAQGAGGYGSSPQTTKPETTSAKPSRPTPAPDAGKPDAGKLEPTKPESRLPTRDNSGKQGGKTTDPGSKPSIKLGGTGLLTVNSRPSSTVMIDGRPKAGSLPIQNIPLAAGKHTLYFSRPEQKPAETTVEIPEGGSVSCVATFADGSGVELDQPYVRCRKLD